MGDYVTPLFYVGVVPTDEGYRVAFVPSPDTGNPPSYDRWFTASQARQAAAALLNCADQIDP